MRLRDHYCLHRLEHAVAVEALTMWSLFALTLIILGLARVGAKHEAGDVEVEFRRPAQRTI
jgi:hypothetical protein